MKRVANVALVAVTELAKRTPVDTSRALSNWVVGIGAVDPSFIGPWSPGFAGSTRSQSIVQTVAIAKLLLKDLKPGQSVFITNSAPYIRRLNNGYSAQAPAGFVQAAVILARRALRGS